MAHLSATSETTSSPQPPDGGGVKAEQRRRMDGSGFEFRAQTGRKEDENRTLLARNREWEKKIREQLRSLEEKDRQIIRLKEELTLLKGSEGRWKQTNESLYDKVEEIDEKRWVLEVEKKTLESDLEAAGTRVDEMAEEVDKLKKAVEESGSLLQEKRKLEIDLEAARRRADEIGEEVFKLNKAAEEFGSLMKHKDVVISELKKRNQDLETEKVKLHNELTDLASQLEGAAKWARLSSGKSGKDKNSRDGDSKGSDPKSIGISGVLDPEKENIEADVHKIINPNSIGISVLDQEKEILEADGHLKCAPKPTDTNIIQLSDDENANEAEKNKKQNLSFASPFTPKCPETKRKLQATKCFAEKQACSKRCKSNGLEDGKLWKTAIEMQKAFENDPVLCMKSVCALYRKHQLLGVWRFCLPGNKVRFCLTGNKVFIPTLEDRGVALGKLLTCEDPDGKMRKSLADLIREDPRGIEDCRLIAEHHHKLLFEIYSNNRDPFVLP